MFSALYKTRNFPVVRPDWLARRVEPALEPDRPIVDAHHHLWDVDGAVYHQRDLAADVGSGHAVQATVLVEARARYRREGPPELAPVGETAFAAAEGASAPAGGYRACAGIVGWADLKLGSRVRTVLEAHAVAGAGRFRGVRVRAAWHADGDVHPAGDGQAGLLLEPAVQQAVRCLAAMDLSLDVWVYHTQLMEVGRLAAMCPQATIVLNHCGGPLGIGPFATRRDEVYRVWRAQMAELARHDNLVVKLGGLGMPRIGFTFADQPLPPDSTELATAWRPYLEACIEAFGARRCMFESNFPVDKGMCSYGVLWNAFKRVTAGCSDAEKSALYAGTARSTYRLPD